MTKMSMEALFEKLGLNYKEMEINVAYDVSDKGVFTNSFNHETGRDEKRKILSVVYKGIHPVYQAVGSRGVLLQGSGKHRIWDARKAKYVHLDEVENGVAFSKDRELIYFDVVKTNKEEPIVDIEVEGNNNYFTNGILSHNTTTGGNALKFYSSIRLTCRKKEDVKGADGSVIGIVSYVKSIKNKVAPPFKTAELKIIFGKGYQTEEELVVVAANNNVIEKSGSWFTVPLQDGTTEKMQGLDRVTNFLRERPEDTAFIKEKVQKFFEKTTVETVTDEDEEAVTAEQTWLEKEALAE